MGLTLCWLQRAELGAKVTGRWVCLIAVQRGGQSSLTTLGMTITANIYWLLRLSALKLRSLYALARKLWIKSIVITTASQSIIRKCSFYQLLIKLPHLIVALLTVVIISLFFYRWENREVKLLSWSHPALLLLAYNDLDPSIPATNTSSQGYTYNKGLDQGCSLEV